MGTVERKRGPDTLADASDLADSVILDEILKRGAVRLLSAAAASKNGSPVHCIDLHRFANEFSQGTLELTTTTLSKVLSKEKGIFVTIMEYACGRVEEWGCYNRVSKQWHGLLKESEHYFLTGQLFFYPVGRYYDERNYATMADEDKYGGIADGAFIRNTYHSSHRDANVKYGIRPGFLLPFHRRGGLNEQPPGSTWNWPVTPKYPHLDELMKDSLSRFHQIHLLLPDGNRQWYHLCFDENGMFAIVVEDWLEGRGFDDPTLVTLADGMSGIARKRAGYETFPRVYRASQDCDVDRSCILDEQLQLNHVCWKPGHSGIVYDEIRRCPVQGIYSTLKFENSSHRYEWQQMVPKSRGKPIWQEEEEERICYTSEDSSVGSDS